MSVIFFSDVWRCYGKQILKIHWTKSKQGPGIYAWFNINKENIVSWILSQYIQFSQIKLQTTRCNLYTIGESPGKNSCVLNVIVNICLYPIDVFVIFTFYTNSLKPMLCAILCAYIYELTISGQWDYTTLLETDNQQIVTLIMRDNIQSQNGFSQQYQ